jgi:hypothetical protein
VTTWTGADAPGTPIGPEAGAPAHGVHVVDRRGLTAFGAVSVALLLAAAGGLVDVLTGEGLRTVFAVCFIAGCAFAALRVHREDLVAAVVMPPLVYAFIALLAGAFSQTAAVGGVLTRNALELATSLVLGAPVLLTATALAFVIAVVRAIAGRHRAPSPVINGD